MYQCPECNSPGRCQETRQHELGVRRRWKCSADSDHRWTTIESLAASRRGVGTWPMHALVDQLRAINGELAAKLHSLESLLPKKPSASEAKP